MKDPHRIATSWLVFGSPTPPVPPLALRAGRLELLFETATGFVRHIALGRHEILRGIYAAVRDRNWGTIPPRLSDLKVDRSDKAFRLAFDVEHRQGEIDFVWRGSVRGGTDGVLTYEFDGQARLEFSP